MSKSYDLTEHQYDVIVVGAGGAGLHSVAPRRQSLEERFLDLEDSPRERP